MLEFQFQHQPFYEHPGLISFRIDWLDLLAVQGTLKESSPTPQFKSINSSVPSFTVQLHCYMGFIIWNIHNILYDTSRLKWVNTFKVQLYSFLSAERFFLIFNLREIKIIPGKNI